MSNSKKFWNKEYKEGDKGNHIFNLSTEPAEDLVKFTRWMERECGRGILNKNTFVFDLGCGNGRNIIYLSKEFRCKGVGYDISDEAIKQAKEASEKLPLTFVPRRIAGKFDLPDESVDLVLDMMASHYLKENEREIYLQELVRILKPRGWLLLKSFLKEEDRHASRLIRENSAGEEDAYIHPVHGNYEHVWAEKKLREFYGKYFVIEKIERSGKHLKDGKAFKRRQIVVYLSKKD